MKKEVEKEAGLKGELVAGSSAAGEESLAQMGNQDTFQQLQCC